MSPEYVSKKKFLTPFCNLFSRLLHFISSIIFFLRIITTQVGVVCVRRTKKRPKYRFSREFRLNMLCTISQKCWFISILHSTIGQHFFYSGMSGITADLWDLLKRISSACVFVVSRERLKNF